MGRNMTYEILEHTGDAKIRVLGKTRKELFLNAMLGMNALLKPKISAQKSKKRKIVITSPNTNILLVDFLNEVNYLRQVNMEAYDSVTFKELSGTKLNGELEGYRVEEFGEDIKAVTFHELGIHKNPKDAREAVVVFDM